MKQLIIGALVSAVAIFVWGFLFWALLSSPNDLASQEDELALQQSLAEHLPRSGMYYVPSMDEQSDTYAERHRSGPIATIFVRLEGAEPMSPVSLLVGLLHEAIFAFMVGLLLLMAMPALGSYRRRVLFVTVAGVAAAFWFELADPIWWYHPWGFHLANAFYSVVAWFIAGLILARFLRPTTEMRMRTSSPATTAA